MSDEIDKLAKAFMGNLSGNKLPPKHARLYSQYSRISMNQPGLPTWKSAEAYSILNDAIRLIEIGFLASESNSDTINKAMNFRRAGELFEWLAHEKNILDEAPVNLFAASCYQLANLPARSSGLAERDTGEKKSSDILKKFLKADFPSLFQLINNYWSENLLTTEKQIETINEFVIQETIRSLGVICAEIRWGHQVRIEKALEKLNLIYKSSLKGGDTYSWLLAYLCYEVAQTYIQTLFRNKVQLLSEGIGSSGKNVLERYVRQNYTLRQSLVWSSQIRGIERLAEKESFALCTPTASGKTTIAELAILQSLFEKDQLNSLLDQSSIVLYLVPSRALAFQLEAKLAKVVNHLSDNESITVTGLYGGTDWGPTDAWLTTNDRTILICTYEKAEALIRFLGVLFINRVSLVVIDEAHLIVFDDKTDELLKGDNRSFRLETLTMRLLNYVTTINKGRAIALSAAAFGSEKSLSGWVTGNADANPEKVNYRSTRQLIGRLICQPERKAEIRFDIMDGESLEFSTSRQIEHDDPTPYVPNPFPPFPVTPKLEKNYSILLKMHTFWAAFCFATSDTKQSVLISVTQDLDDYSKALDDILENYWQNNLPEFFTEPTNEFKKEIWQNCLKSCEDYFGIDSIEFRLLKRGIVVHQGQIPGKISKWLLDVISERIVRVVLATSTLTDGVNLPFEVILIPRLERQGRTLPLREFENLIGRAGRPGFSVEGKSLIVVADEKIFEPNTTKKSTKAKDIANKHANRYLNLKNKMLQKSSLTDSGNPKSSLIALLESLETAWQKLSSSISFDEWLEITAPLSIPQNLHFEAHDILDVVDGALLPVVTELEQVLSDNFESNELEQRLKDIWGRTFAKYASTEEARMEKLFVKRGIAISKIYEPSRCRQIYSTSLQPKYAENLLSLYPTIKQEMLKGFDYWSWTPKEKFEFLKDIINQISQVEKFRIVEPNKSLICTWEDILYWWVDPINAPLKPENNVSAWLKYISRTFVYQISWGLGSIVGLAMNEANEGQIAEFHISDWARTDLPWVIFWCKELLQWGTLDPVAAYLLSKGMEVTRSDAEFFAKNYYNTYKDVDANELLNPTTIRDWASSAQKRLKPSREFSPPDTIKISLLRNFENSKNTEWRVIPSSQNGKFIWMDVAGYPLATSEIPDNWKNHFINSYDFVLFHQELMIRVSPYV